MLLLLCCTARLSVELELELELGGAQKPNRLAESPLHFTLLTRLYNQLQHASQHPHHRSACHGSPSLACSSEEVGRLGELPFVKLGHDLRADHFPPLTTVRGCGEDPA